MLLVALLGVQTSWRCDFWPFSDGGAHMFQVCVRVFVRVRVRVFVRVHVFVRVQARACVCVCVCVCVFPLFRINDRYKT